MGITRSWDMFTEGTPGLEWRIEWVNSIDRPALLEIQKDYYHGAAEGEQYTELDSGWNGPEYPVLHEPASVRIFQDLDTCAGSVYRLKFSFSPRPGVNADDNILIVKWNKKVTATIRGDGSGQSKNNWNEYEYNIAATSTSTRLAFEDGGKPDCLGTFLDDVSLVCISDANHPMRHIQNPDLMGWDIMATWPTVVSDDWICTESEPITSICLWGSWLFDDLQAQAEGSVDQIKLSIYNNMQAGLKESYDQPGELLWECDVPSGSFNIKEVGKGTQGWFEYPEVVLTKDNKQFHRIDIDNCMTGKPLV